jgi:hypothetical protein
MRKNRLILICIGLFQVTLSAVALDLGFEFREIEVFHDVLWLGNSDSDSAPSPVLGVWGAAARFRLMDSLSFRPGIGFYGIEYFYRDGKAFPAEIEYKDAVGTLGILIDPLVVYQFEFGGGKFAAGGGLGPTLSIKIPLIPHGDAPTGEVASYFLENLRFLYMELKGVFDWNITDMLGISVRLRTLLPVFHLWDGEDVPFSDQLMIGAGIGLRIKL